VVNEAGGIRVLLVRLVRRRHEWPVAQAHRHADIDRYRAVRAPRRRRAVGLASANHVLGPAHGCL